VERKTLTQSIFREMFGWLGRPYIRNGWLFFPPDLEHAARENAF